MAEYIKVHAAASGAVPNVYLEDGVTKEMLLPCGKFETIGKVWLQPQVHGGIPKGYRQIDGTLTKPSADSVMTVQVRRTDIYEDVYIAVADDYDISDIQAACNVCCDTTPEITAPTIPAIIIRS